MIYITIQYLTSFDRLINRNIEHCNKNILLTLLSFETFNTNKIGTSLLLLSKRILLPTCNV